jgi:hypothetical protein
MKHEFLISPQLNQAFEPGGLSGGGWGNGITRRSFIKRTGGATVATLVAWNITAPRADATVVVDGSGNIITVTTVTGSAPPSSCEHKSNEVISVTKTDANGIKWFKLRCRKCGHISIAYLS